MQTEIGGEDHELYMKEVYPKFTEKTGFEVEVEVVPWGDDLITKLQTMGAAGTLADVATDISPWSRTFVDAGMCLDVTEALKTYNFPYEDLKAGSPIQEAYTVDGKVYGMNLEVACVACIIVPELFKKAGLPEPTKDWTIQDLKELAKKLTIREGDKVVQWGVGTDPGSGWYREAFLETADAPLVKPDNITPQANHPDAVALMQMYQDMRFKDNTMPTSADRQLLQGAGDSWMTGVYEGKVAVHFGCCGAQRNLDKFGKVEYKFAHLPKFKRGGSALAGTGYFVYSQTKYPTEATQLMFHLCSPETQKIDAEVLGWWPSLKSVRESFFAGVKANPGNYDTMNDIILNARLAPSSLVAGKALELQQIDAQRMSQVWEEGKPVQEVLDQIQKEFEAAIARKS
ncbi:MAG: extracellular solute-binding protein [Chloroflexi bacterium]|nr:extracellular solute-binding protein [Chloroflexota bacterium]